MSSIVKKSTGWQLRFTGLNKREFVYLPKTSKREAQSILTNIESIIGRQKLGYQPLLEDISWLNTIEGTSLHDKLLERGIVERSQRSSEMPTLAQWLDEYIETHEVKESTRQQLRIVSADLLTFFSGTQRLDSFTENDATNFRSWLRRRGRAEATIRKKCSRAKQFFAAAIRSEIISRNPFDYVPTNAVANQLRMEYIEADRVQSIIDSTDNVDLKIVLALCRFAGFRRHETALVKWQDIDWQNGAIKVRSNKNPPVRTCPIFKSLRPVLEAHRRRSGLLQDRWGPNSEAASTALKKHCGRHGIELWGKPLQNLRASCETDLMARFPVMDVTSWLGNSPTVALKHYGMSLNENFKAAQE